MGFPPCVLCKYREHAGSRAFSPSPHFSNSVTDGLDSKGAVLKCTWPLHALGPPSYLAWEGHPSSPRKCWHAEAGMGLFLLCWNLCGRFCSIWLFSFHPRGCMEARFSCLLHAGTEPLIPAGVDGEVWQGRHDWSRTSLPSTCHGSLPSLGTGLLADSRPESARERRAVAMSSFSQHARC